MNNKKHIDGVTDEQFMESIKYFAEKAKYPNFTAKVHLNSKSQASGRIVIPARLMKQYPELLGSICEIGIFNCTKLTIIKEPLKDYKGSFEEAMNALQRRVKEREEKKKEMVPRFKSIEKAHK